MTILRLGGTLTAKTKHKQNQNQYNNTKQTQGKNTMNTKYNMRKRPLQ